MSTGLDAIGPGLMLGRYELLMPIARGGMAAVWAARAQGARGFETVVAVKTMLPDISDNADAIDMFLDEARLASRVKHPNVVQVVDLGEHNDLLYQVMEWVEGDSLSVVIREAAARGCPLTLPIIGRILVDACAGLHAAHELKDEDGKLIGLVHRDISPQNLLVSVDGLVKVADFGIAKSSDRQTSETAPGLIKGKMSYIAPEQALSGNVDRRSDIFALGIILYQLLTSKHPFRGENELATLQNLLSRIIPPPRMIAPEMVPPELDEVVEKALQRKPEDRFATALEFSRAVERAISKDVELATTGDLADFLSQVVGQRTKERRANLKFAMSELQNRRSNAASLLAVAAPRGSGNELSAHWQIDPQMFEQPTKVDISTSHTMMTDTFDTVEKHRRRVRTMAGLSAAAVLLVGSGLFWITRPSSGSVSSAARAPEAPIFSVPTTAAPLPATSSLATAMSGATAVDSSPVPVVAEPVIRSKTVPGRGAGRPVSPGGPKTAPPPVVNKPPGGVSEPGF